MTQRILVTGAAGFIGSQVCDALLDEQHTVIGVDSFDPFYGRDTKERWLAQLKKRFCFDFFEADVRDTPRMVQVAADADAIVHLAARPGVRKSFAVPALYADVNVGGTASMLDAATRAGVRRFVFGSSSSVYGDSDDLPAREETEGLRPVSPYGASKLAAESFCRAYADVRELQIAVLRFFSVYGPRQRPDQAIMRFTEEMCSGGAIHRFGDGASERDFTYVEDVVRGIVAAVGWTRQKAPCCEIFNLGSGRSVKLSQLIELLAATLGVEPKIFQDPWQPGDARRTLADCSKAREILGFEPKVAIEDGITAFVKWYEETHGR